MTLVEMFCMTLKKKFTVEDPEVIRLANGRYAYRVECPWKGNNDKTLHAFKFASTAAYQAQNPVQDEESDTEEP